MASGLNASFEGTMKITPSNIPQELKELNQWVGWDKAKVPLGPTANQNAKSNNPSTWVSFEQALSWITPKSRCRGVGFVVNGNGHVGIDLDHCIVDGKPEPWARVLIDDLKSYTEISPSGTGIRIFVRGHLSHAIVHKGLGFNIEMYHSGRYLSVTGNVFEGRRTIREADLSEFERKYPRSTVTTDVVYEEGTAADDSDLPQHVLERLDTVSIKSKEVDPNRDDVHRMCLLLEADLSPGDALATFKKHLCHTDKKYGVTKRKRGHVDDYLQRTLRDAMERFAGQLESVELMDGEEDDEEFSRSDMPRECLDGVLGRICRDEMGNFPRAYAWPSLLAAAASLMPAAMPQNNLYVGTVGPTGTGKTSCDKLSFHLLSLGKPTLIDVNAGSAEGLLKEIGEAGRAGRLYYPEELGHMLTKSKIDGASFPYLLNKAFGSHEVTLIGKNQKRTIFRARLSVLGGVVEEQFDHLFDLSTIGGLYDRFLFGLCPQPYLHDHKQRVMRQKRHKLIPVEVEIDDDVDDEHSRWTRELGIDSRVGEICIRVATICAAFSEIGTLRASMLKPALALAQYQMEVRDFLQPNPGSNDDARCAFKIIKWMKEKAGDKLVTKREIQRGIHGGRGFGPGVFIRCLKNLKFTGELICESDKYRLPQIMLKKGVVTER